MSAGATVTCLASGSPAGGLRVRFKPGGTAAGPVGLVPGCAVGLFIPGLLVVAMNVPTARLLISCPDASGIIAAVTGFLAEHQANILEADQHSNPDDRTFCMRLVFETRGMDLSCGDFSRYWSPLATRYQMDWRLAQSSDRKRMAILVGKQDHCLHDLLLRIRCGEIDADVAMVISNHAHLEAVAVAYGLPFYALAVTADTKPEQEQKLLKLLDDAGVDFVVLARYMQVLSKRVVDPYQSRIINIHHSFLPAFAGEKPYRQAYQRGVKVIGATAHYVTQELDAGPIIAQDTVAIDHRDTVGDLVRKGRDLERTVLAAAVRLHVEDKILVRRNRTIVFD